MSLKAFHIVFIGLVTLGAAGFGVWAWTQHGLGAEGPFMGLALCGLFVAVGLAGYGVWFLRTTKTVSLL